MLVLLWARRRVAPPRWFFVKTSRPASPPATEEASPSAGRAGCHFFRLRCVWPQLRVRVFSAGLCCCAGPRSIATWVPRGVLVIGRPSELGVVVSGWWAESVGVNPRLVSVVSPVSPPSCLVPNTSYYLPVLPPSPQQRAGSAEGAVWTRQGSLVGVVCSLPARHSTGFEAIRSCLCLRALLKVSPSHERASGGCSPVAAPAVSFGSLGSVS